MTDKSHNKKDINKLLPKSKSQILEAQVSQFKAQVSDLTDALQRERADVINIRRHHDNQMASLRDMVKKSVVLELLPAIDNLERALKYVPSDIVDHDYVKGVSGVVKQFEKALLDMGITRIATVGQPFDANLHEAVSIDSSSEASAKGEGEGDKEVVLEELQPGYTLGSEVIRHAMVKVAKKT